MSAEQVISEVLLLVEQPVREAFYELVTTPPNVRMETLDYDAATKDMTRDEVVATFYIMTGDELFRLFEPNMDSGGSVRRTVSNKFFRYKSMDTHQQCVCYGRRATQIMRDSLAILKEGGVSNGLQFTEACLTAAIDALALADRDRGEENGRIARLKK